MYYSRVCPGCGVEFTALDPKVKYCTRKCQGHFYFKKKYKSTLGERTCEVCNSIFIARKRTARLCSLACIIRRYRIRVFEKLGGKCLHCGYAEDWRALQIDHVNGGGTKERQARIVGITLYKRVMADTTGKYQLLCANCHCIKTFDNFGYGPFNLKLKASQSQPLASA